MIRPGKVEPPARAPFDPLIVVDLGAVVGRHSLEPPAVAANQAHRPLAERPGRPILELANENQPALALDESNDTVLLPEPATVSASQ